MASAWYGSRVEIATCKAAKIVIELVPGIITAAQSAVSNFGLPPADRHRVVFAISH